MEEKQFKLEELRNKIPFWLLIVVNILLCIAVFIIMMLVLLSTKSYVQDSIIGIEYLIESLEKREIIDKIDSLNK